MENRFFLYTRQEDQTIYSGTSVDETGASVSGGSESFSINTKNADRIVFEIEGATTIKDAYVCVWRTDGTFDRHLVTFVNRKCAYNLEGTASYVRLSRDDNSWNSPYYAVMVGNEVTPHYKSLKKKFKKESNQVFFRESLDGKISLFGKDYDLLNSKSIRDKLIFEVVRDVDSPDAYVVASLNKTDCKINHGKKSVELKLTSQDNYTNLLNAYENTYDLIKLMPEITRIGLTKRCLVQIYVKGGNSISNYFGGTYWEDDVNEVVSDDDALLKKYYFSKGPSFQELNIQNQITDINGFYEIIKTENSTHDFSIGGETKTEKVIIWNSSQGNASIMLRKVRNAGEIISNRSGETDVYSLSTGKKITNTRNYKRLYDVYAIYICSQINGGGKFLWRSDSSAAPIFYANDDNFNICSDANKLLLRTTSTGYYVDENGKLVESPTVGDEAKRTIYIYGNGEDKLTGQDAILSDGTVDNDNGGWACSGYIECKANWVLTYGANRPYTDGQWAALEDKKFASWLFYDKDKNVIKAGEGDFNTDENFEILTVVAPTGTAYVRVCCDSQNKGLFSLEVNGAGQDGEVYKDIYLSNFITGSEIWGRLLCSAEKYHTQEKQGDSYVTKEYNTYDLPYDDFATPRANLKKCVGLVFTQGQNSIANIIQGTSQSDEPTSYGMTDYGTYFEAPWLISSEHFLPVTRSAWTNASLWLYLSDFGSDTVPGFEKWCKDVYVDFTLKDAYSIGAAIKALLKKIDGNIKFAETAEFSEYFYGNPSNGCGYALGNCLPYITQKTNILKSDYDQPAQKAEITFKQLMDMIAKCFRCYWFIDDKKRFRIEHVSYFNKGRTYGYNTPVVDLTAKLDKFNKKAILYAQSEISYEKSDLASRYEFGWMDDVTDALGNLTVDISDEYVQKDKSEDITVDGFTPDIDFMIMAPDKFGEDGFALIMADKTTRKVPITRNIIKDEKQYNRNVILYTQNYFASWNRLIWNYMYDMPGYSLNYNNLSQSSLHVNSLKPFIEHSIEFMGQEPEMEKLVKTQIGDGIPEEASVNIDTGLVSQTLRYFPR